VNKPGGVLAHVTGEQEPIFDLGQKWVILVLLGIIRISAIQADCTSQNKRVGIITLFPSSKSYDTA
jgi:hypothetical protein